MRPALADYLGELALAVAIVVNELLIAVGFLQRIEVGTLDVLDDGDFQRLAVVDVVHHHRHIVEAGALRRPPPPLAGDDLEDSSAPRTGRTRIG